MEENCSCMIAANEKVVREFDFPSCAVLDVAILTNCKIMKEIKSSTPLLGSTWLAQSI